MRYKLKQISKLKQLTDNKYRKPSLLLFILIVFIFQFIYFIYQIPYKYIPKVLEIFSHDPEIYNLLNYSFFKVFKWILLWPILFFIVYSLLIYYLFVIDKLKERIHKLNHGQ